MRGAESEFYPGTVAFDRKRTDPTDDVLIVTEAGERTVRDLDSRMRDAVEENPTNNKIAREMGITFGFETPVVSAVYIQGGDDVDPCLGEKEYTFPEFRLAPIDYGPATPTNSYRPHQMALAAFFSELVETLDRTGMEISEPADLIVLAMEAGVPGRVVRDVAAEW